MKPGTRIKVVNNSLAPDRNRLIGQEGVYLRPSRLDGYAVIYVPTREGDADGRRARFRHPLPPFQWRLAWHNIVPIVDDNSESDADFATRQVADLKRLADRVPMSPVKLEPEPLRQRVLMKPEKDFAALPPKAQRRIMNGVKRFLPPGAEIESIRFLTDEEIRRVRGGQS